VDVLEGSQSGSVAEMVSHRINSIRDKELNGSIPLFVFPFQDGERRGGGLLGDPMDHSPPHPLLFLQLVIDPKLVMALLDSGASDSFVSQDVVKTLRLQTYPLQQKLTVRVANGEWLDVSQFVIVHERLGTMPVKLQMRVIKTAIPVVLGYPFLAKFQPHIYWKKSFVRIWGNGKIFEVQALPAADSFHITISTTGVKEVKFDMLSEWIWKWCHSDFKW